jgi:hypothetical protein
MIKFDYTLKPPGYGGFLLFIDMQNKARAVQGHSLARTELYLYHRLQIKSISRDLFVNAKIRGGVRIWHKMSYVK